MTPQASTPGLLARGLALSSQCLHDCLPPRQNIEGRVAVPVEDQAAVWAGGVEAVKHAVVKRQGEVTPATPRAGLRRVLGIYGDILPTGPCCVVAQHGRKLGPSRVVE